MIVTGWMQALAMAAVAVCISHAWTVVRWSKGWRKAGKKSHDKVPESRALETPFDDAPPLDSTAHQACFTVVIPARNEACRLPRLLEELEAARLKLGLEMNVWVVDDHSEDQTAEVATSQGVNVLRLETQHGSGAGKKAALLAAMTRVSTPWVVTLDADVSLGLDWASAWQVFLCEQPRHVAAVAGPVVLQERPSGIGVPTGGREGESRGGLKGESRGGRMDWPDDGPTEGLGDRPNDGQPTGRGEGWWGRVQALDFATQMGWAAGELGAGRPASASGANFAVRPEIYPDTRTSGPSGDDVMVLQRLHAQGWACRWLHDKDARVWTPGAANVASWVAQRLRWAGKTRHYSRHAKKTAWWMATVAATQVGMVAGAALDGSPGAWSMAGATWTLISALHIGFARGVVAWFGLRVQTQDWLILALTQPLQVPLLVLAKTGLLQPFNIPSKPRWKGRTCDP
ncbi:MAG: glycosyltransferase [Bacteroidetes bacterium]|nr:glycosyltransferase [Bacteroidota bacterium]